VSDWGLYGQDGRKESKVNFPFSVRYEPHPDVSSKIPSSYKGDMAYLDQLEKVKRNSNLYKVFAMTKPK